MVPILILIGAIAVSVFLALVAMGSGRLTQERERRAYHARIMSAVMERGATEAERRMLVG